VKTKNDAKALSVQEAQFRLHELIGAASEDPIEISADDGRTAYLVSKRDFDAMLAAVEDLTDQLWLARAALARKGGFAGSDETQEILGKLEDVAHVDADTRERG
jgi:PHD/YefM family antitoxin component YafN of YafNO toxin-antitoxin module